MPSRSLGQRKISNHCCRCLQQRLLPFHRLCLESIHGYFDFLWGYIHETLFPATSLNLPLSNEYIHVDGILKAWGYTIISYMFKSSSVIAYTSKSDLKHTLRKSYLFKMSYLIVYLVVEYRSRAITSYVFQCTRTSPRTSPASYKKSLVNYISATINLRVSTRTVSSHLELTKTWSNAVLSIQYCTTFFRASRSQ